MCIKTSATSGLKKRVNYGCLFGWVIVMLLVGGLPVHGQAPSQVESLPVDTVYVIRTQTLSAQHVQALPDSTRRALTRKTSNAPFELTAAQKRKLDTVEDGYEVEEVGLTYRAKVSSGNVTEDRESKIDITEGGEGNVAVFITQAPSDVLATRIRYAWEIDHDEVADLRVRVGTKVASPGGGWNDGFERISKTDDNFFGPDEESDSNRESFIDQQDQPPNQEWAFKVKDLDGDDGKTGHIDVFEITVYYEPTPPQIQVSRGSYNFGIVDVGTSEQFDFRISNEGGSQLAVETSIRGADDDQFRIAGGSSLLIDAGRYATVTVEYEPDEASSYHRADLELAHTASNRSSPYVVSLAGQAEGDPELIAPNRSFSFGEVELGDTRSETFRIENGGASELVVDLSLEGSDNDQYHIIGGSSLQLGPGEDYEFEVAYNPDELDSSHRASLELEHNATNFSSPYTAVTFSGASVSDNELIVELENARESGTIVNSDVPKGNGSIELYDERGNEIDDERTDAVNDGRGTGRANFNDLDPKETFTVRGYHDPGAKTVFGSREYWGRRTGIDVNAGDRETVTIRRDHPYVQQVRALRGGEPVSSVKPDSAINIEVVVRNPGNTSLDVQPRIVLDRDETSPYDLDRETQFGFRSVSGEGTRTYRTAWTPTQSGDFSVAYELTTETDQGRTVTDGSKWLDQPLVTVQPNREPTASISSESHPSSMYPGQTYTVTATYSDPDGRDDLETVELTLEHPTDDAIRLESSFDDSARTSSGLIESVEYQPTVDDAQTVTVKWSFTLTNDRSQDWSVVEDRASGITFRVSATDRGGETVASAPSPVTASYRRYGTTVLTHGLQVPGSSDKALSTWLWDAACMIRQKAGRGRILVYEKASGEFVPYDEISPASFQEDDFYSLYTKGICLEVGTGQNINAPANQEDGEDILVFNWTKDSNNLGLGYSEAAASALHAALRQRDKDDGLGPLHLLGHSRGAAVMSETAERLLASGQEVEQLTYLDPHDWGYDISDATEVDFFGAISISVIEGVRLEDGRILPDLEVNTFSVGEPRASNFEFVYYYKKIIPILRDEAPIKGVVGWDDVEWVESYYQANDSKDLVFEREKSAQSKQYDRDNCSRTAVFSQALNGRPVWGTYASDWSSIDETDSSRGETCDINHGGIYREYIRTIEGTSDQSDGYAYSRIGGFEHLRDPESVYGNQVPTRFDFQNRGHGIVNGDFERGSTNLLASVVCEYNTGCIPGWKAHGGEGSAELKDGHLFLTNEGASQVSDRFYVPESAEWIRFTYKVEDVGDGRDQLHASIGVQGEIGFSALPGAYRNGVTTNETSQSRFVAELLPVGEAKGTVQQIKFRLASSGSVTSEVFVDDVQIISGTNQPPYVASGIPNQNRRLENGAFDIDVGTVFEDAEASSLQIEAQTSDPSIAPIQLNGMTLTITPQAAGATSVELVAEDGGGQTATHRFAVTVIDEPLPDPEFTTAPQFPDAVAPGEEITVDVAAQNNGGDASYGSISVSFPQYEGVEDAAKAEPGGDISVQDAPGYLEKEADDTIFDDTSTKFEAQYLLVEYADEDWRAGEENRLTFSIKTPQREGTFVVFVRTTLSSGQADATVPESAQQVDQQGFQVRRYEITVTEDAIPVELTNFTAVQSSDDVTLQWRTASEQSNAGFHVQRKIEESDEGATWASVGFVESAAEGGTTSSPQEYRFGDTGLPYEADTLRYRLRQVDLDGTASFSSPIIVARSNPDAVQLLSTFPNPAHRQITIRYALPAREDVILQLYDILGRRVRTVVAEEQGGRQRIDVDVSQLAGGVYFLRLHAGSTLKTRRLTVVR